MPPLLLVVDLQRPWPAATGPDPLPGDGLVAALHDRFLKAVGGSDDCPPAWLQGEWWREPQLDGLRPEFAAVRAELAEADFPVVVDPRLAFALPLWREADPTSRVLLLCGAPWGGETPDRQRACLLRWEAFHAAALLHSQSMERCLCHAGDPAAPRAMEAWIEGWRQGRPIPAGFLAWLRASRADGEPQPVAAELSPSQALLHRELMATGTGRGGTPAVVTAVVTGSLGSACALLEETLFDQALGLRERIGRCRQAVETTRGELAELEQGLRQLEQRRTEMRRELAIARGDADQLRDELKSQLGDWCSLDESLDAGLRIQDTLRTIDAVRSSWTWRITRALTLPVRLLHRLYLLFLSWRRAEPRVTEPVAQDLRSQPQRPSTSPPS